MGVVGRSEIPKKPGSRYHHSFLGHDIVQYSTEIHGLWTVTLLQIRVKLFDNEFHLLSESESES